MMFRVGLQGEPDNIFVRERILIEAGRQTPETTRFLYYFLKFGKRVSCEGRSLEFLSLLTPTKDAPILKVGIYRTSSIGDVVLATACLDLLDRLGPPIDATFIGRGPVLELVKHSWPRIKTIALNRSDTFADIQRCVDKMGQVHVFADLQANIRSRWMTRLAQKAYGCEVATAEKAQVRRSRLLFEARLRGRRKPLPDQAVAVPEFQYDMMANALISGLKRHLPIDAQDKLASISPRPRLPAVDYLVDSPWQKELRIGTWLAIAPGASHPTKKAPEGFFLRVLQLLQHSFGMSEGKVKAPGLVFLGDNNDRGDARKLLDQLDWQGPVLNLAGKLSLWESAHALKESAVLLSNDSSLGHIAEAVDTPTAILFGPTVEGFGFAPRMATSRAFSVPIGCRPCSKHGKVACRYGDQLCFLSIPAEDVVQHLLIRLQDHTERVQAGGITSSEKPNIVSESSSQPRGEL